VVFASSLPREMSLEDPRWRHSAFTKAILDTFQDQTADRNGDGYPSLTEVHGQLTEKVKELTRGRQHASVKWPPTINDFNFYRLDEAPR